MASNRGYVSQSQSRLSLIAAAQTLLDGKGHAAITARGIAKEAGLKANLIYYYFPSIEGILHEVHKLTVDGIERLRRHAIVAEHPLRELWRINLDEPEGLRVFEFASLAVDFPNLVREAAELADEYHRMQVAVIDAFIAARPVATAVISSEALAVLFAALARNLVIERRGGLQKGCERTMRLVSATLDHIDLAVLADCEKQAP